MTKYHDLDPFNHGTTSIGYQVLSNEESHNLSTILKEGWGMDNRIILRLSAGAEKNSNNFRVKTEDGVYLLKNSHINNEKSQTLINRSILYLKGQGVKTPTIIPTVEWNTFHSTGEEIFCVYDFINGENFDGSQQELKNVATEIAKLHQALEKTPYDYQMARLNGSVISHDRKELEKIIEAVKRHGEQTEFDTYTLSILDEIDERSREIMDAKIDDLPFQTIHYDLHPHNVLFNLSKEVASLLDFDPLRYSQRARDVGFGMHRFARTCGLKTERKNDVGVDIRDRGRIFLNSYLAENKLTDKEIKMLPLVIQDEAMRRVISVLGNHYLRNDSTWSFDLPKQVTTLREGGFFSF